MPSIPRPQPRLRRRRADIRPPPRAAARDPRQQRQSFKQIGLARTIVADKHDGTPVEMKIEPGIG